MDSASSFSKYDYDDNLLCHQQVLGLQPHRAHPKTEQSKEDIQLPINDKKIQFHFTPNFHRSSVSTCSPGLPVSPMAPWGPGSPWNPGGPAGPASPLSPAGPCAGARGRLLDIDGTSGTGWKSVRVSVSCTHRGSSGSLSSDLAVLSGGTLER